jgi:hypothetical protein
MGWHVLVLNADPGMATAPTRPIRSGMIEWRHRSATRAPAP